MLKESKNCISLLILLTLACLTLSITQYNAELVSKSSSSYEFSLTYTGTDDFYIKQKSPIVKQLVFKIQCLAFQDFYFKFTDPNDPRFEIPHGGVFPEDPLDKFSFPISLAAFRFQYDTTPFNFRITRKVNNGTIFSTENSQLIYSKYYIQIGTQLDTPFLYGLGQRFSTSFRKGPGKWTIFNRDRGQVIDKGTGLQTYGYYPFYLNRENNKFFHVNYLRNSNAMDVIVEQKDQTIVRWKVIGGVFDFRFFLGQQSPEQTLSKFHIYTGLSAIPPFWSLGFHQCRWGYKNSSMLKSVLQKYKQNDIPLDTIWTDIDYMVDYQDFTIDQTRFPLSDMSEITNNYHYIPIIDAGIKINNGTAYTEGKKRNLFIKDAENKELVGKVWPGATTFVDFFNPNATQYWSDMLDMLYQKVKFSGIWLDMNQYANFCDGPCEIPTSESVFDYSKDLPYNPGDDVIEAHTIPLNSTHFNNVKEADVHAYGAMLQTVATNAFLKKKGLRPFIISRSSTVGFNHYGFHWTGDNYASFEYLRGSIADNFNSQMWGIQMVGPDICGFGGNTTQELCARWFQIGALYPFARNHNAIDSIDQQPYALGPNVAQSARVNLKLRYALLKHFYTIFVTQRGTGTIFKPLFFMFPLDTNTYVDEVADTQFMIGNTLMSAPIVQQKKQSRNVYFPEGKWYDFHTGAQFSQGTSIISNVKITDRVPLFIREGRALFAQSTSEVLQTKDLLNKYILIAGMHFDQKKSTTDTKYYQALGIILSIADFNDQNKIDACIDRGCDYICNMILTVSQGQRSLELDIGFSGNFALIETFILQGVILYYDGVAVNKMFDNPKFISGPIKMTIPIDDRQLDKQSQVQQVKLIRSAQQ